MQHGPQKRSTEKTVPRDKGNINGIRFCSYRDFDQFDAQTGKSVWYIDNVSIDAYTDTNYELANTYLSTDGVKSNAPATGFTVDSISLSRLTNIADPANASLITASYDGDGRMIAAQSKPLSQIDEDAEDVTVAGNTVKSFIFDMKTATPYINAFTCITPATTVRSVDFNEGSSVVTTNNKNNIAVHGNYNNPSTSKDVVVGIENGALKFERSVFRDSSKGYHYDETGAKVVHSGDDAITHMGAHYKLKFDKTVNSANVSMRFKFAGIDSTGSGQLITVTFGKNDDAPGQYLIRIYRKPDGSGTLYSGFNALTSWNAGEMKEDTWYTLGFTYTYDTTNSKGIITNGTVTGNNFSKTFSKDGVANDIPQNFNYLGIHSHRDSDRASTAATATIKTSVWYIDDLKVEY